MDDLISRQELLKRTIYNPLHGPYIIAQDVLDCPSAQQWIPVKWKPLSDLEREEAEDSLGYKFSDDEAVSADCEMPNDGDEIWVCTKSGIVCEDIMCDDYGLLSLLDGDITDIVAWMPRKEPEPYKGEEK